jgi:hypothetical protein
MTNQAFLTRRIGVKVSGFDNIEIRQQQDQTRSDK